MASIHAHFPQRIWSVFGRIDILLKTSFGEFVEQRVTFDVFCSCDGEWSSISKLIDKILAEEVELKRPTNVIV